MNRRALDWADKADFVAWQQGDGIVQRAEKRVYKRRQERQTIIANSIERALSGKPMHLSILWRERDTYDVVYQTLRDAFLLNEGEDFPEHIKVSSGWIDDATLLQPLDTAGLVPKS